MQLDESLMKADQDAWWNDVVKKLERMLREAALKLFNENTLDSDQMHNYFISGESNAIRYIHTYIQTHTRTHARTHTHTNIYIRSLSLTVTEREVRQGILAAKDPDAHCVTYLRVFTNAEDVGRESDPVNATPLAHARSLACTLARIRPQV